MDIFPGTGEYIHSAGGTRCPGIDVDRIKITEIADIFVRVNHDCLTGRDGPGRDVLFIQRRLQCGNIGVLFPCRL